MYSNNFFLVWNNNNMEKRVMIAKLKRKCLKKKRLYMNHSHKNTQLIEEHDEEFMLTLSLFTHIKEAR